MNTRNDSTVLKAINIFHSINKISNKNYRIGRSIAIFIFWIGLISAVVGFGTVLVSAFLMLIEPDTVRTNWGVVPNHARWAYVGTIITGVSIAISGLLSALAGQLSVAIFDMSRKIQNQ